MQMLILILFTLLLFVIFLYSLGQLSLLVNSLRKSEKKETWEKLEFSDPFQIPNVTIQLPIYNEPEVVERLLKNIVQIDYPKEKLEIQVLDDSTDESSRLIEDQVLKMKAAGMDIHHLRRKDRKGFKAGALKEGLKSAKGEFIAIFDSDFLPKKDWLHHTVPWFKNEEVGVVQTRWGHLNRNYSLLTQLQAFLLDFHFILEQTGRNAGNHFINFNGTAGIWRKECILDAGNWEGDTLTEDLDLSYRAQLKGWKFKYLEHVETPAELPITLEAARSQQFRWNKGAAENFQKNYLRLFKDSGFPWDTKFHSFFHLLNSSLFLVVLLLALLSLPLLFLHAGPVQSLFEYILVFFSLSTLIFFISYWFTFTKVNGGGLWNFLRFTGMFVIFFSIAMGLSLHISKAVLEGHLGRKSEFIRTPKFNLAANKRYSGRTPLLFDFQLFLEILLMLLFGCAVAMAFVIGNFNLLLFHLMLFFGFTYVVISTIGAWDWTQKKSFR